MEWWKDGMVESVAVGAMVANGCNGYSCCSGRVNWLNDWRLKIGDCGLATEDWKE